MDKENKEDFSFGRSCDLKVPVTFRMSVVALHKIVSLCTDSFADLSSRACVTLDLLQNLSKGQNCASTGFNLRSSGLLQCATKPMAADGLFSTPSDIYVTCQLLADNKPLTIPFRTSYKAFKNSYTSVSFQTHLMYILS